MYSFSFQGKDQTVSLLGGLTCVFFYKLFREHGVKSYGELLFLKMQHQLWCARFLILGRTSCWCKQILIWIQHKYILNRSKKFWRRLCLTRRLCLGSRYVGTITMGTELCVDFFFFFFAELCVDFRIMCPYLTQLCLHCLIICKWFEFFFGQMLDLMAISSQLYESYLDH